jgi:type IV secretory pathway protease TraF
MLKHVLALPGQILCRNARTITVDGIAMGDALDHDTRGRPLPVWQGCQCIAEGEVFLMNWQSEVSFAGRCFGPMTSRENWTLTVGWRARFGRVLLFDPTNGGSAAYNLLLEVRRRE